MTLVGFEPTIAAEEWPQTYALDCAATGIGLTCTLLVSKHSICFRLISGLKVDRPVSSKCIEDSSRIL